MAGTAATDGRLHRAVQALPRRHGTAGLTLIELIVAFSLMLILSLMALPVARVKIQREQERRLRHALQEIRTAIDRHKDMADEGKLGSLDPNNHGYPESLEALVEGIEMDSQASSRTAGPGGMEALPGGIGNDPRNRNPGDSFGSGLRTGSAFGSGSQRTEGGAFGSRGDPFGPNDSEFDRDRDGPETIRFLRQIPVDPMTGQRVWGLLSVSDDPMSRSWSGRNVFDVYSLSNSTALDGTRYSEW